MTVLWRRGPEESKRVEAASRTRLAKHRRLRFQVNTRQLGYYPPSPEAALKKVCHL